MWLHAAWHLPQPPQFASGLSSGEAYDVVAVASDFTNNVLRARLGFLVPTFRRHDLGFEMKEAHASGSARTPLTSG
jgi:hypothetical protein